MRKLFSFVAAVLFAGSMMAASALSVDFTEGQGDWTIDNVEVDGLSYVWQQNNTYGMKASSYVSGANHATESWLVSPAFSLADAEESATLAFSHARRYGSNDQLSVAVSADGENWTSLTVSAWPDGSSWDFVEATADLSDFVGEEAVQVAFVYTSTAESGATWEIKTAEVTTDGEGGGEDDEHPYDEASNVSHDFASYTLDDSDLEEYGSLYVEAEDDEFYIVLDVVLPDGATELVAGTYPIDATYNYPYQTVTAGSYYEENFTPSYLATIDGEYIDKVWWIVEGTVVIAADGTITVNAKNSLGNTISVTLTAGEEGIENVVLTESAKKVVVDGVVYIVRDNKMFDVRGNQVR